MDRLDELDIFVAVLQYGSLAQVARKTGRSAPAITRAIASLEQRFGARLVERTTRRLAPTEAGARLAERAQVLIGHYQEALFDTTETQLSGLLRLTAPVQFGRKHITPLVMEFLTLHPDMQIDLTLNDRNLDLIDEGLDLAIRIGHLEDSSKVARKVGQVTLSKLKAPRNEWRFGPHEDGQRVRLAPRLLFNEAESQLMAVRAGHGIARLLSYQVADDIAAGTMVRLLPDEEPLPMPVQLVAQKVQRMPRKVRTFWDFAWERLSQLPQIHQP